jgi:alcohol dehydrogenase class IV
VSTTTGASDFTWIDGERLIRFGPAALDGAPELLAGRGFGGYALITTERAAAQAPILADGAAAVLHVPAGPVPEVAAAVRDGVGGRPLVALGGGRAIDAAKGIAGADGLACAAVPTTLSGAPMTSIHRMPAGVDEWRLVRPSAVLAEPGLMASQPSEPRAASAMNALAHAAEALYGPVANPVAELAALRAANLLAHGVEGTSEEEARPALALGAILAGYAVGSAGIALHHLIGQTLVRVTGAPHALAYAVLLPHTLRAMVPRAARELAALAAALGAEPRAEAAPERVARLAARSGVTRLSELGVGEDDLDVVVEAALARPDLGNTPDPPGAGELRDLLERAL